MTVDRKGLRERLARIVDEMPKEGSVTLPVAWLREQLEDADPEHRIADLTVGEVADELGRAPSTIRGWLGAGELRGYRFRGREWRVPPASLAEFVATERGEEPRVRRPTQTMDLGAWRQAYQEEGGP